MPIYDDVTKLRVLVAELSKRLSEKPDRAEVVRRIEEAIADAKRNLAATKASK